MKIIITGALGHIGSKLIREIPFWFPDVEIVLIDNLYTQRYCSLFNLPTVGIYRFIQGDILELELLSLIQGADVVIHLAAITNAAESINNKELVDIVNIVGSEKVATACARASTPMIFLSTTSVYGAHNETVYENCLVSDLNPESPYADSKLKAELIIKNLGKIHGLNFTIFRFGTIFGASPGMRFHTAVNKFCWQAVTKQPITVWRNALHQNHPYLALVDGIKAIQFVLERKLFENNIYNVLTLNTTVSTIVDLISSELSGVSIEYVDPPILNQRSYYVSNDLLKKQGFTYQGDLSTGIGETISLFKTLCK